jgi:hypothetical protein
MEKDIASTCDKADFKLKLGKRDKEGHFILKINQKRI